MMNEMMNVMMNVMMNECNRVCQGDEMIYLVATIVNQVPLPVGTVPSVCFVRPLAAPGALPQRTCAAQLRGYTAQTTVVHQGGLRVAHAWFSLGLAHFRGRDGGSATALAQPGVLAVRSTKGRLVILKRVITAMGNQVQFAISLTSLMKQQRIGVRRAAFRNDAVKGWHRSQYLA